MSSTYLRICITSRKLPAIFDYQRATRNINDWFPGGLGWWVGKPLGIMQCQRPAIIFHGLFMASSLVAPEPGLLQEKCAEEMALLGSLAARGSSPSWAMAPPKDSWWDRMG